MTRDTRIALFLMGELVAALRANDPDTFTRWLCGGIQDLGEAAVIELLMDWLTPLLTIDEKPMSEHMYQQAFDDATEEHPIVSISENKVFHSVRILTG